MNDQPCYRLFVYGSLRKGFESPAYGYISSYFDFLAHAKAPGMLYDLGEYPAATPNKDAAHNDASIVGELYTIRNVDEFEWAIAQLDDYEGVDASYDEPALYYRSKVSVLCEDGQSLDAWIYWYKGDTAGKPVVASGDILEYLRQRG